MTRTALILGATGGIGGETARALITHGWHIRALTRRTLPLPGPIEWIAGDVQDRDRVLAAAAGVQAIVHAVNPPGYRDWSRLVLPMIDNSIAAAEANDARLVLPGTVYNYDPRDTPVAEPATPQQPSTRKGAIRVEMERRIEAACKGGMRALILRAGDYFGPRPGNGWLSQGMLTPGKPVRTLMHPGAPGVGHAWAYLPDVAETFARLLDRDDILPAFARYHFAGYWDPDGTKIINAIAKAVHNPDMKVRRMPWRLLPLIAPFNPTMREMIEMEPFWKNSMRLDNRALVEMLGDEPHTPLATALETTLRALGCMPVETSAHIA